jgi:SpoVK/Ycf46/Vps4 family AAA+-type ATPase
MPYGHANEFGFALNGVIQGRAHFLKLSSTAPEPTPQRRKRKYNDDKLESNFERHDPPERDTLEKVMTDVQALVGLPRFKTEFVALANTARVAQARASHGLPRAPLSMHLAFLGGPGTGKTTCARLVGRLYHALGLLERGHVIETERSGLLGGYMGQTVLKTDHAIQNALGGVLFIDEAYALLDDNYGSEVIDVLVKAMEDHRDQLCVVLAGYASPMQDLLSSNAGLRSRFNRVLLFEHYSSAELLGILQSMCARHAYDLAPEALHALRLLFQEARASAGSRFGNGRFVRNAFEKLVQSQANRLVQGLFTHDATTLRTITLEDVLGLSPVHRPRQVATIH